MEKVVQGSKNPNESDLVYETRSPEEVDAELKKQIAKITTTIVQFKKSQKISTDIFSAEVSL